MPLVKAHLGLGLKRYVIVHLQDDQCGESEVVSEDDNQQEEIIVDDVDVEEDDAQEPCFYALWSPWSACGVTCGWGIKVRMQSSYYECFNWISMI